MQINGDVLNNFSSPALPLTSSVSEPKSRRSKGMAATRSITNHPLNIAVKEQDILLDIQLKQLIMYIMQSLIPSRFLYLNLLSLRFFFPRTKVSQKVGFPEGSFPERQFLIRSVSQ